MEYFPAFLNLRGRRCLIVGGGEVALRKARLLASAGAHLSIVAPDIHNDLAAIAATGQHQVLQRRFIPADVLDHWLVVSATGIAAIERCVFEHATEAGIFCNGVDDIDNCSYITPAIVDRGSIVVAISSAGTAPVLARKLRGQIEMLLPNGLADLAALAGRWRERTRQTFADLLSRRRFWESVFDGPVGRDAIAGNVAAAETGIASLLDNPKVETDGEAWLVGAGPGDPGLLTIRALQIMQMADVILHDRLVSPEVLNLARRDADFVSVGKLPGCCVNSQDDINTMLVNLVAAGKRVCRLKGGDPFIFGRGGEEAEALEAAGLRYQVVPGITAAAGCSAAAGIPLTHRELSQAVVFATAHGKNSVDNLDWTSLARERQTMAFYMAVKQFSVVMNKLIDHGRSPDTPLAIIENGTRPEQRVVRGTLGQLTLLAEANRIVAPAMLIVGEVAVLGCSQTNSKPQSVPIYDKPELRIQQEG